MIVIADTTPLHCLILLDQAEILRELYGRVIIPKAVVRELQAQREPAAVREWIASPPDWLGYGKLPYLGTWHRWSLTRINLKPSYN